MQLLDLLQFSSAFTSSAGIPLGIASFATGIKTCVQNILKSKSQ